VSACSSDTYAQLVWELAQVNVATMRAPLDDPSMAGIAAAFDPVARLAGFRVAAAFAEQARGGRRHGPGRQPVGVAPQPSTALWWVQAGERPDVDEALARLAPSRTTPCSRPLDVNGRLHGNPLVQYR
jgi:hypothetical protein